MKVGVCCNIISILFGNYDLITQDDLLQILKLESLSNYDKDLLKIGMSSYIKTLNYSKLNKPEIILLTGIIRYDHNYDYFLLDRNLTLEYIKRWASKSLHNWHIISCYRDDLEILSYIDIPTVCQHPKIKKDTVYQYLLSLDYIKLEDLEIQQIQAILYSFNFVMIYNLIT